MIVGNAHLAIGELSKRTGVNIETVRFYEKIGILPAPPRSEGGRRIYEDAHVGRLTFVRRARELGFTLDEVRSLLELVDGARYSCGEVRAIALERLTQVQSKITDLRRLERTLRELVSRCDGGPTPHCPIISALFSPSQARPLASVRGRRNH